MSFPLQQESSGSKDRTSPAYLTLQQQAAWTEMRGEEAFELTGGGRVDFLNSYLTQDIKNLSPNHVTQGAFLTQKGKLVSEVWVMNLPDKFLLLFPAGYGAKAQAHLATFLQFADAAMRDANSEWTHLAVLGPKSQEILGGLGLPVSEDPGLIQTTLSGGAPLLLFSRSRFGIPAWDLLLSSDQSPLWRERLKILPPADDGALETLRIEAGIPRMGVDMGEDNLVAEVGLDQAATSFNKGCYLGQETTARVQSRGHVNRKLTRVRLSRPFRGTLPVPIRQGEKQVGTLSSTCESPKFGGPVGLATVQLQAWENTEPLLADSIEGKIELRRI